MMEQQSKLFQAMVNFQYLNGRGQSKAMFFHK